MSSQEQINFTTYNDLVSYSQANPTKLIVMDFKATWCAPCKAIKPFFKYLEENYPNVIFQEIDIENDDTQTITETLEIAKVPTFIYFKNGSICHSIIGTNKENIENAINDNI
jgi:thioredoxin 1